MTLRWRYETCKKCRRNQRIAWSIKDEIWEKVVPEKYRSKVLCLECFLKFTPTDMPLQVSDFVYLGFLTGRPT